MTTTLQKPLVWTTVIWVIAVLLRFLFYHELKGLWLIIELISLSLIVAGVVLAVVHANKSRLKGLPFILGISLLIYLFFFTSIGWKTGTVFRFARLQSSYQSQVDDILKLPDSQIDIRQRGQNWQVDLGPPRRIAFSWGGIIDNWSGMVYDPSGDVLKASQFKKDFSNWDDPDLRTVKRLFGGDMRSAWHLWGDWYYCAFT